VRLASRFALRVFGLTFAAHVAISAVVTALAPTLLLLEAGLRDKLLPVALVLFVLLGTAIAVGTFAVVSPLAPLFDAKERGADVAPEQVRSLEALPARLTFVYVGSATSLVAIFTATRSARADEATHLALAALAVTLVIAVSLASFTVIRSQVSEIMEDVPPDVVGEAFDLARAEALTGGGRVEARITLAVAAPAALVAVGALLLVYAHARAASTDARVNAALAFTRATLEPVEGEPRAYEEIAMAAGRHGYSMTVSDEPAHEVRSQVDPHGEVTVHAPYGTRSVVVRFDAGAPGDNLSLVVAVAGLGIAFAAVLGGRLGSALSHDVEVARLQVDAMGARDVRRGIRLRKQAAFRPVHDLAVAIEKLGSIFREFAFAQERAIVAKHRVEQTRGLFLASMSHDLKAPLNAVLGFAELVKRQPLTEGQRESLAIIEQRGRELLHLVRTILDASRADAKALELSPEEVHIEDVVTTAVLDARDLEGARIVAEVTSALPPVKVDPQRLAQAVTLVVLAAARLGGKGVSLRASRRADVGILIDVEAPGNRLSADERAALFAAFENAESARVLGSLGLGLTLARTLLRAHGGELEIEAAEGAEGTLFRMRLPAQTAA
jgi:signal transduction histidine kinase